MKKWVLGKWNSFLVCNYWGGHYFTQVSIMHLFLSHYVYVSLIQVPRSCLLISSKRLEIREMGSWGNGIMQEQLQIWTEHSTLIFENVIGLIGYLVLTLFNSQIFHMCFDRFLLAFESRDLSQADKSIERVFSFPK